MKKKNGENLCNQKLTLRFEISEVNMPLARSIRKKKTQITNFRNQGVRSYVF